MTAINHVAPIMVYSISSYSLLKWEIHSIMSTRDVHRFNHEMPKKNKIFSMCTTNTLEREEVNAFL